MQIDDDFGQGKVGRRRVGHADAAFQGGDRRRAAGPVAGVHGEPQAARAELAKIDGMGGAVAAIDYMKAGLVASNTARLSAIEAGETVVVGVNRYTMDEDTRPDLLHVDEETQDRQLARLEEVKAERDDEAVEAALDELRETVEDVEALDAPDGPDPRPEEVREGFPFLKKQLQIIEPEVIVTLGRPASQTLLESEKPLGALRGSWHTWGDSDVMPTYHPAYLLRNPEMKKKTWADLQQVMDRLGLSR